MAKINKNRNAYKQFENCKIQQYMQKCKKLSKSKNKITNRKVVNHKKTCQNLKTEKTDKIKIK